MILETRILEGGGACEGDIFAFVDSFSVTHVHILLLIKLHIHSLIHTHILFDRYCFLSYLFARASSVSSLMPIFSLVVGPDIGFMHETLASFRHFI